MKQMLLFIATGIIVFCIVPTTTTQAIPREAGILSQQTDSITPVLVSDVITQLDNPETQSNILAHAIQEQQEITVARRGSRPGGNKNPYVKRRGYGDSTMGDDYDNESAGHDEEYGDDSAIEYNDDLDDSSGYNEDL